MREKPLGSDKTVCAKIKNQRHNEMGSVGDLPLFATVPNVFVRADKFFIQRLEGLCNDICPRDNRTPPVVSSSLIYPINKEEKECTPKPLRF